MVKNNSQNTNRDNKGGAVKKSRRHRLSSRIIFRKGYDRYSEVAAETIIFELGDESLFEDDDFNNDSFSPNK